MQTSPDPQLVETLALHPVTHFASAGLQTKLPLQSAAILH
jgi:hypothetical protein